MIGWVLKLRVQTFQPPIRSTEDEILKIINVDIQQFVGYCLIPLDPWYLPDMLLNMVVSYHDLLLGMAGNEPKEKISFSIKNRPIWDIK